MGTPNVGRWIVAAALALAVAACAWVVATAFDEGADLVDPAHAVHAETASVGEAAVRRAAPGPAKGDDVVPAVVDIDDAPLAADATGTIRGTVRDDLGRPVADAIVRAIVRRVDLPDDEGPSSSCAAETDAEGVYVIDGLEPDVLWRLRVDVRGHDAVASADAVALSAKRLEATYDFVVPRDGSIDAVVLDAAGAPIPHSVRVYRLDDEDEDDWGYDTTNLEPGRWRVLVKSPGRATERRVVDVAAGATTRAEFRLGDAVEISGALLDADGAALWKYDVVAIAEDADMRPLAARAATAEDGSFRIAGLSRVRYRLVPGDADLSADTPGAVLAPASGVRVQLRLESKVTFRLVYPPEFTDADRAMGVNVELTVRDTMLRPSPRWDLDTGTVRIPGGEDALLAITVVRCRTLHRRVNVRPGDVLDLGDLRPEPAWELTGRVVDADGRAVSHAIVWYDADGVTRRAVTADDGSFLLPRMPPADCSIDVDARGFAPVRAKVRFGDAGPATIALARGGVLRVRGETRAGAPVRGAAVRLVDARGEAWPFGPGALDGFGEHAARVGAGTWRVEVAGCEPVTVDVREDATTSVRVVPRGR